MRCPEEGYRVIWLGGETLIVFALLFPPVLISVGRGEGTKKTLAYEIGRF